MMGSRSGWHELQVYNNTFTEMSKVGIKLYEGKSYGEYL